ncbi:hypothetical protein PC117_g3629 [Phytophthora cactorum]|uniref:Uncharacterized protein n=1 Tax=Phytophthora cactorum TaxID=29920 RepID=A0A8T1E9W6_9STRA|nr:hypothetical protein PC117_g3629 [Phytophthora cactorum]
MILSAAIKAARRSHAHTSCLQYNSVRSSSRRRSASDATVYQLYCFLAKEWSDMLPFNDRVYTACHNIKRGILAEQIELDSIPVGNRENLQKVGYSGHKQRHCSLSTIRAFVPRMDCAYRILDLLKDDFMILQCCVRASCPPI